MNKIILITGATSGFGKAAAEKFAAEKWDCIITGRRHEKLHLLAHELRTNHQVRVLSLAFDVQNRQEVFHQLSNLPQEWQKIDVLLNNAGLALGREHIDEGNLDDWDTMINTNLKGLLYVTKAVLPYMTSRKQGHIINLGSVAGKNVYENGNVYCASKAAVDTLSHAMRIDLLQHNIKVTAIHPGAATTAFANVRFKGDENKATQTYKGFTPLSAGDVAGIIYYAASLPPHICINDLVVTCTAQADGIYFYKQS